MGLESKSKLVEAAYLIVSWVGLLVVDRGSEDQNHFHSKLIKSAADSIAEKVAIPDLSWAGFDVIDEIKTRLENTCRGKASCADILALYAMDLVAFQGDTPLEQATATWSAADFTGKGDQDPSLNPTDAAFLKTKCKSLNDATTTVEMDPGSSQNFETAYFANLKQRKGLFQSDPVLLTNKISYRIVGELPNSSVFYREFAQSMKRMGAIGVLTGTSGEIRRKCSVINS
ncbi:hypothetical protein SADUNF_Sadunf14G0102100 [Salix dunnii]|uniref:peroxidase n=1 Tax=Salix dunnii TaxID=1413687 RepID=A0A835MTU5_9ROSI|nr:hypothetical protein SADUNF_Sadunf14G0102100 [Salix dunnii]